MTIDHVTEDIHGTEDIHDTEDAHDTETTHNTEVMKLKDPHDIEDTAVETSSCLIILRTTSAGKRIEDIGPDYNQHHWRLR